MALLLWGTLEAWRENQAGPVESALYEATVKANWKHVSHRCSDYIGLSFWNALKTSKRSLCLDSQLWSHLEFGALMMENVSIASEETSTVAWETPYIDSKLTVVHVACTETTAALHEHGVASLAVRLPIDVERTCSEWVEQPVVVLPWFT